MIRLAYLAAAAALVVLAACQSTQSPKLTVAQQIAVAELAVDAACVGAAALQQGGTVAPVDAVKVTAGCTAAQATLAVLSAGLPPTVAAAPASAP